VRHAYYFLRSVRGNTVSEAEKRWMAWPNMYQDPQFRKPVMKAKKLEGERVWV